MATSKSSKSTKSSKKAVDSKPTAKSVAKTPQAKSKRQLKAVPVSVREQASLAANKPTKRRKRSAVLRIVSWPFVMVFRVISTILRPFAFLLVPFRTRPARAIGRFLASVLFFRYFRNSWKELRQVEWPNARETAKLTLAVFLFAIFFSLIVSLADWIIGNAVEKLIIN